MPRVVSIQSLLGRLSRWPVMTGALVVVVLGAAILLTTLQLRQSIRQQIAGRDGEVLNAVLMMEYENELDFGLSGPLTDPANQLSVVLKTSELRGVLGVRLYDLEGEFVDSFPPHVKPAPLDRVHLSKLRRLNSSSTFHSRIPLNALFYPDAAESPAGEGVGVPVLEANVPLHESAEAPLAGIAQFLIEGSDIAAEFDELDRHLLSQAGVALLISGGLLVLVLAWAFSRLHRAHSLVARQTDNLLRANRELALAAKTSALGAVAAHLIHGLKNPLAGLQNFVASRNSEAGSPNGDAESWEEAAASTRRMNSMIQRVISVLREEQTGSHYSLSTTEIVEMVSGGLQNLADERSVSLKVESIDGPELDNRSAHLVALILENLAQNAIEASPADGTVLLRAGGDGREFIQFEVADTGPGFPADQAPFEPCRSTKEGGSGIGLALCRQLANHLGARLELERESDIGCRFVLELSTGALSKESDEAPETLRR